MSFIELERVYFQSQVYAKSFSFPNMKVYFKAVGFVQSKSRGLVLFPWKPKSNIHSKLWPFVIFHISSTRWQPLSKWQNRGSFILRYAVSVKVDLAPSEKSILDPFRDIVNTWNKLCPLNENERLLFFRANIKFLISAVWVRYVRQCNERPFIKLSSDSLRQTDCVWLLVIPPQKDSFVQAVSSKNSIRICSFTTIEWDIDWHILHCRILELFNQIVFVNIYCVLKSFIVVVNSNLTVFEK